MARFDGEPVTVTYLVLATVTVIITVAVTVAVTVIMLTSLMKNQAACLEVPKQKQFNNDLKGWRPCFLREKTESEALSDA
jgi:hypothetical protein